jgi:hypothetical protein
MADTAKRLSGPVALTVSAATYYTVPASTACIVRSIHVTNTSATVPANFTMSIGANATGNALFTGFAIAASGVLDWSGFLVLNAADTLQALASVAATLTLVVSGIEVA